jgi:hypothetical protein
VVGANSNAKIMLHGLVDLKNENFNNIFTNSFSSIASDLLNNKILKITDHLGSSVFVVKSQNFKKIKLKKIHQIKHMRVNHVKIQKLKEKSVY